MIRPISLFLAVLPCGSLAGAGEIPPLVTDRPDFTESAETVPRGSVQLEFGYTFGEEGDVKAHALGELLVRAAVAEWAELRVGLNSWAWVDGADCRCSGLEDSSLGAKFKLVDAQDEPGSIRPAVALLVGTSVPTGDDDFGEDEWQPEVKLALALDLSDRAALSSNIGYAYPSEDGTGFSEFSGSLSLGIGITGSLGCYVEYFQFLRGETGMDDQGFINGGLTLLTGENLQFDWRVGYQVAGDDSEFFTGVGASWRWLHRH
jgi:hypothetical protein